MNVNLVIDETDYKVIVSGLEQLRAIYTGVNRKHGNSICGAQVRYIDNLTSRIERMYIDCKFSSTKVNT